MSATRNEARKEHTNTTRTPGAEVVPSIHQKEEQTRQHWSARGEGDENWTTVHLQMNQTQAGRISIEGEHEDARTSTDG
jgi:hypothetical protein